MAAGIYGLALWFMLGLTGWLAWTVALNTPFMPDGLPRAESVVWPGLVLTGCALFAATAVIDLIRGVGRGTGAIAALALAVVLAALAVRLTVLPLLPTLMPLTLIGLREALSVLALLYAGFALWHRARGRAERELS